MPHKSGARLQKAERAKASALGVVASLQSAKTNPLSLRQPEAVVTLLGGVIGGAVERLQKVSGGLLTEEASRRADVEACQEAARTLCGGSSIFSAAPGWSGAGLAKHISDTAAGFSDGPPVAPEKVVFGALLMFLGGIYSLFEQEADPADLADAIRAATEPMALFLTGAPPPSYFPKRFDV